MDDYQIQADLSNCTLAYACKSATENLFPHSHDDYAVKVPHTLEPEGRFL